MSKPDPQSWTLLFKKHKTTILLMLLPHESIASAKDTLLRALKARNITEINGDLVPDEPSDIEFGLAVDRSDPEKGWTGLEADIPDSNNKKKSKRSLTSLQAADIRNGQIVAFRFRKLQEREEDEADVDMALDIEDQGWDIVLPSLEEDEAEEEEGEEKLR